MCGHEDRPFRKGRAGRGRPQTGRMREAFSEALGRRRGLALLVIGPDAAAVQIRRPGTETAKWISKNERSPAYGH